MYIKKTKLDVTDDTAMDEELK